MTQAAEVLRIAPGPAFADDLLDALRAEAAPGSPRPLHHAAALAAVAAGGATFYGLLWLRRRGAAR